MTPSDFGRGCFLSIEMGTFVRMMLISPIAAVLMNLIGIPVEATALLGMLVPMFLMNRVNNPESN